MKNIIGKIYNVALAIDRNLWKKYFGIETPLYKRWWKQHVIKTQRAIQEEKSNIKYFSFTID